MIKYSELKAVIEKTTKEMDRYKPECTEFLCMLAAHESGLGRYRKQIEGPALSLFQIEPRTHNSIWDNCDSIHKLAAKLGIKRNLASLENDDRYAVFVARCYLLMDKNPLPRSVCAMGDYAKCYWNNGGDDGDDTNDGKASPENYVNAYIEWRVKG